MAVRTFSGTDPDYEMVAELKEPYAWSVGTIFAAKRKRDGLFAACKVIQLATADGIELVRCEIEAQRVLDSCRGCRRWSDDIAFDPATLTVHLYSRTLAVDEEVYNLRTVISEPAKVKNTLNKGNVFQIMASLVLALQDCHAKGIVHGDIKPECVTIRFSTFNDTPFASAALGGFGINTWSTIASPPGTKHNGSGVPGSPCYMAPECLDANNPSYSVKSDIFSLGCTLHELVCKTKAFTGTDRSSVPAMTATGATFLGNSLAPMPGKMMQLHPDQRPNLDALEKWSRDYCLHRVVKKLGQAAWTSMALQVGAVTSVHNPVVAGAMLSKSREISAKTQALNTAATQQAAVDAFFEVLTPPVEPASAQQPPVQADHSLTTPPQLLEAPGIRAPAGRLPQAPRGLDPQYPPVAAPFGAAQVGVPIGYPPAVQAGYTPPLAQPAYPMSHGGYPPAMLPQPAVPAMTPAPATQVPQAPPTTPAMVPTAVYPGAAGQTGNLYPVLTQHGYIYVMFPPGMLPHQPGPAAAMSLPSQMPAAALPMMPAQPATPAFVPATFQPTSQALTGYPPAMPPVQHIPAATASSSLQLPAVASLPPQEPEREAKADEATSRSLAVNDQPTSQSVTGYPPAIPPVQHIPVATAFSPLQLPAVASLPPQEPEREAKADEATSRSLAVNDQPTSQSVTGYPPAIPPVQHIPAATASSPLQLPAVASLPPQEPEREAKADEATSRSLAVNDQPTNQSVTGYPPAMPSVQHIPAATAFSPLQLPAVASLPPQEPEREAKADEATSRSLAANDQPTSHSVTGYPPAIPPPAEMTTPEVVRDMELAMGPSSTPAVPPAQAGLKLQDPAVTWLATQPLYLGQPAPTPATMQPAPAAARAVAPISQPPASTIAPAAPRAPAGDDLQFKSPLGSRSNFALSLMKSLSSPAGSAALSHLAANAHHPVAAPHHHMASPLAAHSHHSATHHQHGAAHHGAAHHGALNGALHGLQHLLHPQSPPPQPPPPYTQHAPPAAAPGGPPGMAALREFAATDPALTGKWPGGEPPPLAVSKIAHMFPTREAAEKAAASPAFRIAWYKQQAQFALSQSIQMGQFAATNANLAAQSAQFNAWKDSANAQYAAHQQGLQQLHDARLTNDANRHANAQAFSLVTQGNTVLEVPFGGGAPYFAGGNQVSADGGLYVVGDPNRIIQG